MLFYFSWFKYLFLIIGSPVFVWLSEKTEAIMYNLPYPFNLKKFLNDISRGIGIALRNALWQTVYSVSILILSFVPVVGWATPVLALLVEFFFLGFSMVDYTSKHKGLSTSESVDFINNHKGLAIGNGMVFYLMHALIVVGWIFAPGYAVIAATISLQEKKNKSK